VVDAYPGYWGKCSFDIENTGTIPAEIYRCTIQPVDPAMMPSWLHVDWDNVCNADTTLLKPKDKFTDKFIGVTIKDSAPENAGPITFKVTILAKQWNAP
ncbi:unnamed protein product, partial [marine sediment metagenome]